MKHSYFALKASLPMLRFDEAPPVSSEKFLDLCTAFLEPDKMKFIASLKLADREIPRLESGPVKISPSLSDGDPETEAVTRYVRWEICLRNTLAQLRAGKLSIDPEPYLVQFAAYDSTASATASEVFSSPGNPVEKERMLDAARWYFLEGMEWAHPFDFEGLCIYRYKLLLLEKMAERKSPKAAENLDKAAGSAEKAIYQTDNGIISKAGVTVPHAGQGE